jgi:benzoylformate decarboxylase
MPTVRAESYTVLRGLGLTRMFANPGSTEIDFLAQLPTDIEFVLGLHEASVIGMATGHALASGSPALAVLHTTGGFGNAIGALATARDNGAPLVVIVGQQDRRHLAANPFLTGRLEGLAGSYPVWFCIPARAEDVPGAIHRAWHEATHGRGPAVVVVPMDDWHAEMGKVTHAAPGRVIRGARVDERSVALLADMVNEAESPCLVVGAAADTDQCWQALVALAERITCPVYQEAFGARAGFPQDHPRFAGHLPADRPALRKALAAYDLVVSVGAPLFRQHPYSNGPFVADRTRLALVTDRADDAHCSPAELVLLGDPAYAVATLVSLVQARHRANPVVPAPLAGPVPRAGHPLLPAHVLAALGLALPPDAVVVEETPSSRPALHALVPARANLGFLSAAMGGLGFALPASVGVRMANPDRPVVAVLGDGSSLYSIQALWSAVHYKVGVLVIILVNGRYAIMDRLAERAGALEPPWPAFAEIDVAALAHGFGCTAWTVRTLAELNHAFDELLPTLKDMTAPLVLDVHVGPDTEYAA